MKEKRVCGECGGPFPQKAIPRSPLGAQEEVQSRAEPTKGGSQGVLKERSHRAPNSLPQAPHAPSRLPPSQVHPCTQTDFTPVNFKPSPRPSPTPASPTARPLLAQAAGAGPGRPGRPGAKAQAGQGGALREVWSAARRAPRSGWHRLGPPLEMRTRWATPRCAAGLPALLLLGCLGLADPSEHAGNRGLDAALGAAAGCGSQVTSAFPTRILGVCNGMREPAGSCEESGVGPRIFCEGLAPQV